jgi:hypothetical protein
LRLIVAATDATPLAMKTSEKPTCNQYQQSDKEVYFEVIRDCRGNRDENSNPTSCRTDLTADVGASSSHEKNSFGGER